MSTTTISGVTKDLAVRHDGAESQVTVTVSSGIVFSEYNPKGDPVWGLRGNILNTRHLIATCGYMKPTHVEPNGNTLTVYYTGFIGSIGEHGAERARSSYAEDVAGAALRLQTHVAEVLATL